MSDSRPTLMWEAAALAGRGDDLVEWVRTVALPRLPEDAEARVFRSHDDRVVVIATSTGAVPRLGPAPAELVRRSPHQWRFDEVDLSR